MSNIAFVSLGCDKNLVDSEVMLGVLNEAGFNIVPDESSADIVVVNTCCFIKDALEESIETILEMAEYKKSGSLKGIIVAGCLGQRYNKEIFDEMPEVDAVVGTTAVDKIAEAAEKVLLGYKQLKFINDIDKPMDDERGEKRLVSSSGYFGYLKIAEGCNNFCTYCIIPKMRGKYRSRKMESLINEAELLAKRGVKELIIVAQDIACYGIDIYGESKLHVLLERLCNIDDIQWIRLLYCYPENITDETIETMKNQSKICNYIDMPLQHVSDTVLKRMGRKSTKALIHDKIKKLRKAMPDIAIRTTFIVGFPNETEGEFNELLEFVKAERLERLGVFTYSQEEGTPAALMEGQIDEEIKQKRKDIIMETQKAISAENCLKSVGKTLKVIIEGKLPEDNVYCGRTYKDAPEIDGLVFVSSQSELISGEFVQVNINKALDYDLMGEVVFENESTE